MGTVHRGRHGWHHLAAMEMAGFFFITIDGTNHSFKKAGNKCRDCRGLLVNMQYIYIYHAFII